MLFRSGQKSGIFSIFKQALNNGEGGFYERFLPNRLGLARPEEGGEPAVKTRLGSFLVWALYAFGTICVVLALLYWLLSFYASLRPETTHFYAGKTNLVELWGFGLISLGVGRALRILEGGGRP